MGYLLKDIAWRGVRECWREEAREWPKLEVLGRLMDCECRKRCAAIDCKRKRSKLYVKLRGRTTELRIETNRWCGLCIRKNGLARIVIQERWTMSSTFCCAALAWLRRGGKWRSYWSKL